ncbi:hypothetical protein BS17DRAFT_781500 [Gyrodon lividus]|nr:hypothetical protein BS17DRAFT_781500 [Gyrodon lividus]
MRSPFGCIVPSTLGPDLRTSMNALTNPFPAEIQWFRLEGSLWPSQSSQDYGIDWLKRMFV